MCGQLFGLGRGHADALGKIPENKEPSVKQTILAFALVGIQVNNNITQLIAYFFFIPEAARVTDSGALDLRVKRKACELSDSEEENEKGRGEWVGNEWGGAFCMLC